MSDYTKWLTAVSTWHTDEETLRHYVSCGIGGVELSVNADDTDQIDWAGFRKHADAAGIEICSFHLPFSWDINIAVPDEEKRTEVVRYLCTCMAKAAAVGIRRFVVHPSSEPIPDEERAQWMAQAKKSLRELAEYAKAKDAVVCVEDLPRTCLGHTTEEMIELLEADARLCMCFDVNHLCREYGSTHHEMVEKLGHLMVTTHMSDYDFVDEKHLFPGVGMIDWKSVVEDLEAAGYEGPFLYEGGFEVSARLPSAPVGKIEWARERHLHIKDLTGKDHIG